MTDQAIGCIDHIVIAVSDLDGAATQYRNLGFTLSPKGIHSATLGSANHTIMLRDDYFELLTVLSPTDRNAPWRKKLSEGGGIAGIALTTDDAAKAHALWSDAGFQPDDLIAFSRRVVRQDGVALEARFEVVSLSNVPEAGVRVFVCSQPTREAVWLPELTTHPNAATGIKRVLIAASDPAAAALQWLRLAPHATVLETDDGPALMLGTHAIQMMSHAVAEQRFGITGLPRSACAIGVDFEVADIEAAVAGLLAHGVPHERTGTSVAIVPVAAAHVRVAFTEAPHASHRLSPVELT